MPLNSPLNWEQKKRVEANIGLVGLHLKKHVPTPAEPHRLREYHDLFQEGCFALIRAAQTYRPQEHGAFAAYALPRIRVAIHHALYETFATVRIPVGTATGTDRHRLPRCESLGRTEPVDRRSPRPDAASDTPSRNGGGHNFTERFRRALETAKRTWLEKNRHTPTRAAAAERIVAERMLVPEPQYRTSLRDIAGPAGVSKATVLRWERQLFAEVRRRLSGEKNAEPADGPCQEKRSDDRHRPEPAKRPKG